MTPAALPGTPNSLYSLKFRERGRGRGRSVQALDVWFVDPTHNRRDAGDAAMRQRLLAAEPVARLLSS